MEEEEAEEEAAGERVRRLISPAWDPSQGEGHGFRSPPPTTKPRLRTLEQGAERRGVRREEGARPGQVILLPAAGFTAPSPGPPR